MEYHHDLRVRPERPEPEPAWDAGARDLRHDNLGRCRALLPRHGERAGLGSGVPAVHWIQEAGRAQSSGDAVGVVLNAAAYTHTSIALHDAIAGSGARVIELHISNVYSREPFRHLSYVSPVASGIIVGFGVAGYPLALRALSGLG